MRRRSPRGAAAVDGVGEAALPAVATGAAAPGAGRRRVVPASSGRFG
jgi:hypothetical protein